MTTAERTQIQNPAEGLIIYNFDTDHLNVFFANNSQTQWEAVEINEDTADFLQMRFGKYKPIYPALSGITQLRAS